MIDQYLANPALLKGQPKRLVADYVEQNGILVPRRFESLEEARKSGLPIIARSELLQDYDGCSGLVISPRFSGDADKYLWNSNLQSFIDSVLDYQRYPGLATDACLRTDLKRFCAISQINPEEFIEQLSFSFWEYVPGFNRTVTADSVIKEIGRAHV